MPKFVRPFDPAPLAVAADWLVVALAFVLPWSTSAVGILLVLWLLALIPTLEWTQVRRELVTPAGGLPVALFLFGVLGTAWADVSLAERWHGLDSFFKLLAIPLLFAQFRRSDRGPWVLGGYAASCVVVLLLSFLFAQWPEARFLKAHDFGVPVRGAATQSGEFVTCIAAFLFLAFDAPRRRQWLWFAGLLAVMFAMLGNIFFVATGRTALVVLAVLLVLFAFKRLNLRGALILFAVAAVIAAAAWSSSRYLRDRTMELWTNFQQYEATDARNSAGERIEFAKKSMRFVLDAPVIGHGTGSIHKLFEQSAKGHTGAAGTATTNPHNQTFAVAIQLGLLGALVLWAMWIVHLMLFRGSGLAEWVGLIVVTQNIVGSLFNSHLFDFVQGWVYVLGVGVAGGMVLGKRATKRATERATERASAPGDGAP